MRAKIKGMSRESKKSKKERLERIIARLEEIYPESVCALEYGGDPWRLLVMGRLSAQCTDARVNIVCRALFERFPTLDSMADAPIEELEKIIHPCGLYRTKAASVKAACERLRDEFGGVLPADIDKLLTLSGVGRKIANLLLGDVFGINAIVADTHCIRICGRLGAYEEGEKNPYKIEKILAELLPEKESADFCHRIVHFGREVCAARAPACERCELADLCRHAEAKKETK